MRYSITYLIYAAVLARAFGWSQDSSPIPLPAWIMLGIFGTILFTEKQLSRRLAWYPRLYVLVQSGLGIAMLYSAPQVDIFPMLFYSLSIQAVQFFGSRIGFVWIGAFILSMLGLYLFISIDRQAGLTMVLGSGAVNILMGIFASLIARTDRERQANQHLFSELQEAYRHLKDSSAQAEALAAAEERHRLGRELHDSLTQTLFSMNLASEAAQLALQDSPQQVDGHLARLQALSLNAAREVQSLTGQTPAGPVSQEGLEAALRQLAIQRREQDGLQVVLQVSGERRLPASVETALYRIVQEALNNVVRHAGTKQARVRLNLEESAARLEIEDDGCGFETAGGGKAGGYGLAGMAERAVEIGWKFEIQSRPGQGTYIRIQEKGQ